MKIKLLFACAASLLFSAVALAQDPYTLTLYDQAVYYGMYEATVSEPVPEGAIRLSNSSYSKMLTEEQLASFGNTLTMTVTLRALCDNYDRIGNVNLTLVPKGQESYSYNDENIKRIEIGRFITPFMRLGVQPLDVPYVFNVDNLTNLFHDANTTSQYDIWIELEVYGYQGGPGQGGAAVEVPGCQGRNDVYMGSLEFVSGHNPDIIYGDDNFFLPLSYKYELKNYTLEGTDVLGETVRTINFTLDSPVPNAKLYIITSNHGANTNGEEYVRRDHFIYFNDELKLTYKPGGVSCVPFSVYNTQPNCIYRICYSNGTSVPRPDTDAAWSWNNWCPGDKIPIRVVELGDLPAGDHSYRIEVPDAVFAGGQGYFPMSVYMQGVTTTLDTPEFANESFSIYPNPVTDVATIISAGSAVKTVAVINTLGQIVYTGTTNDVNLSQLQNGMYIVKVTFDDSRTAVQKIIKK